MKHVVSERSAAESGASGSGMMVRGIRGATTAEANTPEAIWAATRDLLTEVFSRNGVVPESIAAIIFSTTPDLDAAFPAAAARQLGLTEAALFGAQEVMVAESPAKCIRVLVLLNTTKSPAEIRHVYLGQASSLRPDLGAKHLDGR